MRTFIAENGSTPLEQEAVFNLGAGMIAAVAPSGAAAFERVTAAHGVGAYPIGRLDARPGEASVEYT
jgi:phosphoribosylaminoimidazole (AIR) synthetase